MGEDGVARGVLLDGEEDVVVLVVVFVLVVLVLASRACDSLAFASVDGDGCLASAATSAASWLVPASSSTASTPDERDGMRTLSRAVTTRRLWPQAGAGRGDVR